MNHLLAYFKKYLSTLKLGAVSRKLYFADVKRFLLTLDQPSLAILQDPATYTTYLSGLANATLAKRTLASLRQFGSFLAATYSFSNPVVPSLNPANSVSDPAQNYLKSFTNHLTKDHCSSLTIKAYKSDISRYLTWLRDTHPSTQLSPLLTPQNMQKYLTYLSDSHLASAATLARKAKSLHRFAAWHSSTYPTLPLSNNSHPAPIPVDREFSPPPTRISSPTSSGSENFVKKNNSRKRLFPLLPHLGSPALRTLVTLLILVLFSSTLAIFGYRQFSRDVRLTQAYPATPVTPNRQLSFQGRLENASGTPVTGITPMTFKLFTASSGGSELYSTGSCNIDPDADGVFNTQIGDTCGDPIAATVFTENQDVWLEVTVDAETLDPRQQIATVAYALNSETLQGFPLSSTVSAIKNSIVAMNQWGEIIVGEQSPRLTGVSGTFQISAPALSLVTATGTNGNITLAPDGTGQVNVNGNTTSTNFFNVSNAQLTTGSLITGTVGNDNSGFKLLDLLSGASPTSKFSVADDGDVITAGTITLPNTNTLTGVTNYLQASQGISVGGGTTYYISSSGTANLNAGTFNGTLTLNSVASVADNNQVLTLDSGVVKYIDTTAWDKVASDDLAATSIPWLEGAGILYPKNSTLDLLVGGQATSSAKFAVLNMAAGTPTASISGTTANVATYLTGEGNLATTNMAPLTLGGASTGPIQLSPKGTTGLNVDGVGNVGIGTVNPASKLQVGTPQANQVIGNTPIVRVIGSGNSQTPETLLRLNRAGVDSVYYPAVVDFNVYSFDAPYYGPGTQLDIALKSAATWTETPNVTVMSLRDNGNVGIGTTTPTAKLDVAGDASTSASLVFSSATPTIDLLNNGTLTFQSSVGGDAGLSSIATLSPAGNLAINGDLTVTGDDLYMGTNTAGMLLIADGTNFNPTAMSGDITIDGTGATAIGDNKVVEADLKAVDAASDEECLTYETTTGDFEWQSCAAASMTSFTVAGDAGGGQAITDGNTLSILGGTNGIDTADSATDTVTLNLDTTEIGTTTFGAGAGITWTFDASAGTDTTIAFGDNTQTYTTGTAAFTGDLTLTSAADLIFGGTTSLAETTSPTDSGAYLVGVNDEFDNSASTTVQGVLNDLDSTLTTALASGGPWIENASGMLYPKNSTVDLLVGGQATASAKFAFLNLNSGDPIFNATGYLNAPGATLSASVAGNVPLTVKAAGSQTGNLITVQNNSSSEIAGVDSAGRVFSHAGTGATNFIAAGAANTTLTGTGNTLIGNTAGLALTTSSSNIAIGYWALRTLQGGSGENVALGSYAMSAATTNTSFNVAIGGSSLSNATLNGNTAVGRYTLNAQTSGLENVGVGYSAGRYNVTGDYNTWLGSYAGLGVATNSNSNNVGLGYKSGYGLTTGSSNIFLGYLSGYNQTTNSNLFIVDNQQRANAGEEQTNSVIYGVMAATPANQSLRINAVPSINGAYTLPIVDGTANYVLTTNGSGATSWGDPATLAGASIPWIENAGLLYPKNSTLDLLVGGQATSSAKFKVLNMAAGTPTASISGSTAGNALYVTGDGTIATTLNRSLLLNPTATGGHVGIGTTAPDARLEINHATGDNLRLTYNDTDGSATAYTDFSLASDGDLTIDSAGGAINLSDILNFAGGTTYYVDASGNAKFNDLIVADTGSPGLTIGDSTNGQIQIGDSTITDNNTTLTIDSSTNTINFGADDTTLTAAALATLDTAATVGWDATALNMGGAFTLSTAASSALTLNVAGGDAAGEDLIITANNFDVDASGNIAVAGNVTTTATSGTQGWWSRTTGNLAPVNLNDTLSATTSADIALTLTQNGTFNALLVQDEADDSTPFVINQSGNVGIGTTNPTVKLHVVGPQFSADYPFVGYIFDSQSYGADVGGGIGFGGQYNSGGLYTAYAGIRGGKTNATDGNYSGYLSLYTRTSGEANTEKMRITNAGLVGIGTTTPSTLLYGDYSVDGSGTSNVFSLERTDPNTPINDFGVGLSFLLDRDDIAVTATESGRISTIMTDIPTAATKMIFSTKAASGALTDYLSIDSTGLVNVSTGNLKVGNGTPGVTLNGEDAYIEGTFEVDGTTQLDNTLTVNGNETFYPTSSQGFKVISSTTTGYVSLISAASGTQTGNMFGSSIYMANITTASTYTTSILDLVPPTIGGTGNIIGINMNGGNGTITSDIVLQYGESIDNNTNSVINIQATGGLQIDAPAVNSISGLCHDGADVDNAAFTDRKIVACNNAAGDLAEWYETDGSAEAGSIVTPTHDFFTYTTDDINPLTGLGNGITSTHSVAKLTQSTTAYDAQTIGIITTSPYQVFGSAIKNQGAHPQAVALNGRVPVKISPISAPIRAGDPITSSTDPGKGIKATRSGRIVGTALENWDPNNPKEKIEIFVVNSFYDPDLAINNSGDVTLSGTPVIGYTVTTPTGLTSKIGAFAETVAGKIRAGLTRTNQLEVGTISPLSGDQPITVKAPVVITPPTSATPALSVSGEIVADTVSARVAKLDSLEVKNIVVDRLTANQIEGLDAKIATLSAGTTSTLSDSDLTDLTDRIKARLQSLVATDSATAIDLPTPPEATTSSGPATPIDTSTPLASDSATLLTADINYVTVNNYLAVIGSATITQLSVTDTLNVNQIQSTCTSADPTAPCLPTLALQPLGGTVNLAQDTLIVDSSGAVSVNGSLSVTGTLALHPSLDNPDSLGKLLQIYNEAGVEVGSIDASGSANLADLTTRLVTIAAPAAATDSAGLITTTTSSNATAGNAVLVAPNTELTINSPFVTSNSLVYLTPTGNSDNKVLFVKTKQTCDAPSQPSPSEASCVGGFTVAIDAPATSDIPFNWWIIQLDQPSSH